MSAYSGVSANDTILNPDTAAFEYTHSFLNGGRGACFIDINNDGLDDIYVVGPGRNQLFLNKGAFAFSDITDSARVGDTGYGMACASADLNNDGYQDIIATNYYSHFTIYRNNGDGTFTNMTNTSGIDNVGPQTGVAIADFDGDGLLDFFVTSYNRQPDHIYRNKGNFTFEDKTDWAGISDLDFGFQPIVADYNRDGRPDIYVLNDFGPDALWENLGHFTFANVADATGANDPRGGMGGAWGDFNGDGQLDLFVGNWQSDGLYQNDNGSFHDVGNQSGVDDNWTTWGAVWFDFDNDGHMDLYFDNGNVDVNHAWLQPNKLFRNNGDGNFTDVTTNSGAETGEVSHGLAAGDLNNDGLTDLYVLNINCPNMLLKNTFDNGNTWLHVRLRGTVSNRDGVGATVTVKAGSIAETQLLSAGSSYLSSNSKTLDFGLKNYSRASEVDIDWPSGLHQVVQDVAANQTITVVEDDAEDPVARAADLTVNQGETFELNGTGSSDNVRVVGWNWTVTLGTGTVAAEGAEPFMTIYTPGTFQGRLEVRDPSNRTGYASFNLTVRPVARVTVDAGPDLQVQVGDQLDFKATGTSTATPNYASDCTFVWSFWNGSGPVSLSGPSPSYVFDRAGSYLVTVAVTDPQNATASDNLTVTVMDAEPPVPRANVPLAVDEDAPVLLDASQSTDNQAAFATTGSFVWSYVGYAGPVTWAGARVTAVFPDPGVFTLTLTERDASGNAASLNFTLRVRDLTPPTPNAGPDRTASPGQEISLSAAASTDNDPLFLSSGTFTWAVEKWSGTVALSGPSPVVSFAEPGLFRVLLDAWDPSGNHAAAPDVMYVRVLDEVKPTANAGGDRTVEVGEPFRFDGSLSTDNDPSLFSTGSFLWEFQDASQRQALPGVSPRYVFAHPGTYAVRLTVTDAAGNAGTALTEVTAVDREPPTLVVDPIPSAVEAGRSVLLNASGTTDNSGAFTLTWRIQGPDGSDTRFAGATAQVALVVPGLYLITVRAQDASGNSAAASFNVTAAAVTTAEGGGTGGTAGGSGEPGGTPAANGPSGLPPSGGAPAAGMPVGAALAGVAAAVVLGALWVARRRSG